MDGLAGLVLPSAIGNHKRAENDAHIWAKLQEMHGDKVEMMPEDTDWLDMDWIIK